MDFKEVCCNIRSCLNSSKSQLSMNQLMRDYHEVLGESIPFRSLGYNSVESLLRAVPNLRISSIRGEIFIDVKPDEKTAHIANLVREQRCAKKKKRKPSRGFYRGGAPPPRRPATIPPPRRSAPPSREYYPSRRRDSPPKQSYQSYQPYQSHQSHQSYPSYQNQRKPSPPRRPERDSYYSNSRKNDPPAYQGYRNSAPIEISSDEDTECKYNGRQTQNTEDVRRKYCSQPSQYDFSDPNDDNDDYASDLEDCDEINNQMEELKVTLGQDRQVSINKPKLRSYPSNTSNEDDIGYSSMNTGEKTKYCRTISSESYDYDDDDEFASSTTTTTESAHRGRPFGSYRSNGCDTDISTYSRNSRGRGSVLENHRKPSSTSSIGPGTREGNIKVTVPNGSGRGRVVAFLLR